MEALGAGRRPPLGHRDGIVGKDGPRVVAAFPQPHAAPLAQVDRGDDDHRHSFTSAAKFSSRRMPAFWLFSGWNCVAQMGPASIAAAKRTP